MLSSVSEQIVGALVGGELCVLLIAVVGSVRCVLGAYVPPPQLAAGNGHADVVSALWAVSGITDLTPEALIARETQRVLDEASSASNAASAAAASGLAAGVFGPGVSALRCRVTTGICV